MMDNTSSIYTKCIDVLGGVNLANVQKIEQDSWISKAFPFMPSALTEESSYAVLSE